MRAATLLAVLLLAAAPTRGQTANLSGTWKLDRTQSVLTDNSVYPGLGGSQGVPNALYVTQARNGTLVIGSDMNTSLARTYVPGSKTSAPLERGGDIGMATEWQAGVLVSEGRDQSSGSGIRERLSREGETLVVEITLESAAGSDTSRLVYRSMTVEPPCTQWSTPCRDWTTPEP